MTEVSRFNVRWGVIILIVVVVALVVIDGFLNQQSSNDSLLEYEARVGFLLETDSHVNLDCRVADTPSERLTGLMYITSLHEREGMLFVLEGSRNITLWMKNTEIPLDMIFVDEDLRVVNIEEASIELPDTPDSDMTRYHSGQPVLYVIEANMGFCSTHGIEPGTEITITFE